MTNYSLMRAKDGSGEGYKVPSLVPFPVTICPEEIPYNYQLDGAKFLLDNHRAILADDMGLGKTLQAILAAFYSGSRRILVIVPSTLLRNWTREIYKWLPGMTLQRNALVVVDGTLSFQEREEYLRCGAIFTLIPYSLLGVRHSWAEISPKKWTITSTDERHLPTITSQKWDCIVVDEAHRLVNRHSNSFQAMKEINKTDVDRFLFLLTGTPLLNRPDDLWPSLHLINPKRWSSFHTFLDNHCETKDSKYQKHGRVVLGLRDPEGLQETLRTFMLRRLKDDCLELPEKTIRNVDIDLYDDQRSTYETMRRFMYAEMHGVVIDAVGVLAKTTRERQIAVSPDLLVPISKELTGAKIDMALELIEECIDSGQKFVLFSQFAQVIQRLSVLLDKKKVRHLWFTGQKSSYEDSSLTTREKIKDGFNASPDIHGLMTTIQCGGEGHTFTSASFGILTDFMWSPLRNAQAIDRLHRIGQTRDVDIRVLVAKDTIEERVMQALENKMDLFNAVIPVQRIINILKDIFEKDYGVKFQGRLEEGEFYYDND